MTHYLKRAIAWTIIAPFALVQVLALTLLLICMGLGGIFVWAYRETLGDESSLRD